MPYEYEAVGWSSVKARESSSSPSVALCCKFAYDRRRLSETLVFILAPLNLVPLLLAWSTAAFRDLGAAGLLAAGLHIVLATQAKSEGLKHI